MAPNRAPAEAPLTVQTHTEVQTFRSELLDSIDESWWPDWCNMVSGSSPDEAWLAAAKRFRDISKADALRPDDEVSPDADEVYRAWYASKHLTEEDALAFLTWRWRRYQWRDPIDSSLRMEWRNMGAATGKTAVGVPIYASPPSPNAYAKLSTPGSPRPATVALPADLYAICAQGEIEAWGRFNNEKQQQIPVAAFTGGKRPEGWTDICYLAEDLRRVQPPASRCALKSPPGRQEPNPPSIDAEAAYKAGTPEEEEDPQRARGRKGSS